MGSEMCIRDSLEEVLDVAVVLQQVGVDRGHVAGGDVAPVNTDLLKNYADIEDFLKEQPFNSVDGQMYGVPHGWGANLLMYNTDVVSPAPTSWGAVFDDAGTYAGKVTAYDSPIYIADAALYLMKTQPDLGIKDPYALDGGGQHQGLRARVRRVVLRHLPRQGRGLRRADPLLDHADRAVPGRSHGCEVHRLRRLDDRVDGDQGIARCLCSAVAPTSGWVCSSRHRCCGWEWPTWGLSLIHI